MARADLRRVSRASQRLRACREELEAAIIDAAASGETYRDIAQAAGMSHQRVGQIVQESRGRST